MFRTLSAEAESRSHEKSAKAERSLESQRSSGPSRSSPWLLGGSEDPWYSVPILRRDLLIGYDGKQIIENSVFVAYENICNFTFRREGADSY